MKTPSRERAIRILLAVFLKSDLSAHEIRAVMEELNDPHFSSEFAKVLMDVLERLSERHPRDMPSKYGPNARMEAANFLIKRQRLSKREVMEKMEAVAPHYDADANLPMRQMLLRFYSTVDDQAAERFHNLLSGQVDDDPYLRGIMKKR